MDLFSRIDVAGPDEVLVEVSPAIGRRVIGVGALALLAVLVVWFGFTGDGSLVARIALIGLGAAMLAAAHKVWSSSGHALELTPTELREAGGEVLCRIEDIVKIERGMQIFKPANGLLVHLKEKSTRRFVPGLWWRWGKLIAIGGMTNAGQGKAMAEVLQILLRKRDGAPI